MRLMRQSHLLQFHMNSIILFGFDMYDGSDDEKVDSLGSLL